MVLSYTCPDIPTAKAKLFAKASRKLLQKTDQKHKVVSTVEISGT